MFLRKRFIFDVVHISAVSLWIAGGPPLLLKEQDNHKKTIEEAQPLLKLEQLQIKPPVTTWAQP